MIVASLHRQPVPLDSVEHRRLTLAVPSSDRSVAAKLNSIFVGTNEFPDACRTFPLVFIHAGKDEAGQDEFAPIAILGLAAEENLYLVGNEWRATYDPMVLRCYPFGIARIATDRYTVCVDMAWSGAQADGTGQRIFTDEGEPTEFTKNVQGQLEHFEVDIERTRRGLRKIAALGVMREMRFDGTLPNGEVVAIDGFFTIDEPKVRALADEVVLDLHRDGLLATIHAHWFSLGHLPRLLQWHAEKVGAPSVA